MRTIVPVGSLAVLAALALAPPAEAASFRAAPTVTVGAGEVVGDDLYVAGAQVTIDGHVTGDLVVAGGSVTVRGRVDGDLLVAGGTVVVSGPVGRAVRVAGADVRLEAPVGGDLLAASGQLVTRPGVTVGGETLARATDMTLDGRLGRALTARGENVTVLGAVAGPAALAAPRLRVAGTAAFAGPLRYETITPSPVEPGARTTGGITGNMLQTGTAWQAFWPWLLRFVTAALAGLLLLMLVPVPAAAAADTAMRRPHWRMAAGLGVLFGAPMAAIMGMLTVILLPVGLMLLGAYAAALYLAQLVVAWGVGRWLLLRLGRAPARWQQAGAFVAALGALYVLKALPVVGPYLNFVIVLWGLGAIAVELVHWWRAQRPEPAAAT